MAFSSFLPPFLPSGGGKDGIDCTNRESKQTKNKLNLVRRGTLKSFLFFFFFPRSLIADTPSDGSAKKAQNFQKSLFCVLLESLLALASLSACMGIVPRHSLACQPGFPIFFARNIPSSPSFFKSRF